MNESNLEFPFAGFKKRVLACIVDLLILSFVMGIMAIMVTLLKNEVPLIAGLLGLSRIFVSIFYYPIFESSKIQATLGKHLFKLQVSNLEGNRITFWRALCRNLIQDVLVVIIWVPVWFSFNRETNSNVTIFVFTSIIVLISLSMFLMAIWTKKNQAFHDKIVGTVVLDVGTITNELKWDIYDTTIWTDFIPEFCHGVLVGNCINKGKGLKSLGVFYDSPIDDGTAILCESCHARIGGGSKPNDQSPRYVLNDDGTWSLESGGTYYRAPILEFDFIRKPESTVKCPIT